MAVSRPPERLAAAHRLDAFECSQPSLTRWLQEKALKSQTDHACSCFVICDDDGDGMQVVGFYALASGSVSRADAPGQLRRNMPDPIPVALLGRLAVHSQYERQGLGAGMLKDAIKRLLRTSEDIGIRAILCHAIDGSAKDFYLRHGFVQSPVEDLTVMLNLTQLVQKLAQQQGET